MWKMKGEAKRNDFTYSKNMWLHDVPPRCRLTLYNQIHGSLLNDIAEYHIMNIFIPHSKLDQWNVQTARLKPFNTLSFTLRIFSTLVFRVIY